VSGVKVGITLPSFVGDPEVPLALARAAQDVDLDGVFVFDHLFRRSAAGGRRPALDSIGLLGALSAVTDRIALGTLVFRASLRPAATLAAAIETAVRVSSGRLIAGIGAGDSESREENESFGLGFGTVAARIAHLEASVRAARDLGAPIWVGGHDRTVREVAAAAADGWNAWGGTAPRFAHQAAELRTQARRSPFHCTWGGLTVMGDDDDEAAATAARLGVTAPTTIVGGPATVAARVRAFVEGGADWVILGPVDSSNPENARRLAAVKAQLV
jgi:alkanesulfonate monooxygenase SsuD/methylene tetrahydromethanopterin reductase-like flavin-dependent oxidoreductase (luciferase family)